jgi:hypothetical protein
LTQSMYDVDGELASMLFANDFFSAVVSEEA